MQDEEDDLCDECQGTGFVEIQTAPDDSVTMLCPEGCGDPLDFSEADEESE